MLAWLIEHPIRVLPRLHLGESFQRLEINDARLVLLSVAAETALQIACYCYAVHPRSVGDLADNAVFVDVDYHHFCSVAHVQPAAHRIYREIVPSPFTPNLNFFEEMVGFGPGDWSCCSRQQTNQSGRKDSIVF